MSDKPTYEQLDQRIRELEKAESERQRNEKALMEKMLHYRALMDVSLDGIAIIDQEHRVCEANRSFAQMLGYTPEEVIGLHTWDWEATMTEAEIRTNFADLTMTKTIFETRHRRKDGTIYDAEVTACGAKLGDEPMVLTITRDITESKHVQETLLDSERRFRHLFEKMSSGVAVYEATENGEDFLFKDFNKAAEIIEQISKDELIGRNVTNVFPNVVEFGLLDVFKRVWRTGVAEHYPVSFYKDERITGWRDNYVYKLPSGEIVAIYDDATERKRAEEALRQEQDLLKRVIETSPAGITIVNHQGQITFANTRAEKVLGLTQNTIIQRTYNEPAWRITDYDGNPLPDEELPFRRVVADGQPVHDVRHAMELPDGRKVFLSINAAPLFSRSGEVSGMVATVEDITERKRVEEEKERLRAHLANAVEMARLGPWEYDVASDLFTFNDHFYKIFRTTAERAGGYTMSSAEYARRFVHPDDVAVVGEEIRKAIETKDPDFNQKLEHRMLYADGTVGHISVQFFIVKDAHGQTIKTYGVNQDITDRKRREEELLLNERRTATLLELSQMTEKSDTAITDFTLERAVEITGSRIGYLAFLNEEETVLSMHSWSRTAMKECMIQNKPIQYPVAGTGLWGEAVRRRRPIITNDYSAPNPLKKGYPEGHVNILRHMNIPLMDGGKIVLVAGVGNKAVPYDDGDAQQLKLLMDGMWKIIKSKRADKEKDKLQAQLNQAQKMESVGRLAGGVAHDFNNMLGIIIGNAELAMMQMAPTQALFKNIQEILKASKRSADLVRQLLAFASKQTVRPRVLDLNDTVEGILKMLRRLIGEDIDLAWMPGPDLRHVKIDPSQIDQILANLTVNARDAIAGVGKITIETDNATLDEAYCADHLGSEPGRYVLLAVSDNGSGMSKEVLEHLFEPFFSTKELGKGTGLGLSSVYGVVKQNGGFINVYSEPGKGTTFKIYLPGFEVRDAAMQDEVHSEPLQGGTETVLMVEDEAPILQIGKATLERLGYKVLTADTPGEAIRLAGEAGQAIHLLFTDVVMPGMNGKELEGRIRAIHPGLKCLYMSGYTANAIAHHGVLDEGVHFIHKPFTIRELAAKVREVMDKG